MNPDFEPTDFFESLDENRCGRAGHRHPRGAVDTCRRGEFARCLSDVKCASNIACLQTCNGRPDETECQVSPPSPNPHPPSPSCSLPCLLMFSCLRDTFVPEKKRLSDPRRLYAPGRLYHLVYSKVWRCASVSSVIYNAFVIRNFVVPRVENHTTSRDSKLTLFCGRRCELCHCVKSISLFSVGT